MIMSAVAISSAVARCNTATLMISIVRQQRILPKIAPVIAGRCRWAHNMNQAHQPVTVLQRGVNRSAVSSLSFCQNSLLTKSPAPENIGSARFFSPTILNSRKGGSRMGHHVQNLNEMANEENREEARNRREEKKKKTKKARVAANKEDTTDDRDNDTEEEEEDDSLGPNEDEFGNPLLPDVGAVRSKMLTVVASIERSFSSIRGGEATPELFDNVRVSAYGEVVPLSSVGQVVIEDPQRATISCYDPSVVSDVRDAVRDMPGMNLNPYVEEGGSGVVIIPIPRVSEETRKEIVKELGRQAENGRQRVRRIRRDAMDVVKKGKDGKLEGISKDDAFRCGKDIETATEEVLSVLNGIVDKKQKSVMED